MGVLSSTKPDAWTLSPQMTAAPDLWRDNLFLAPIWGLAPDLASQTNNTDTLSQWGKGLGPAATSLHRIQYPKNFTIGGASADFTLHMLVHVIDSTRTAEGGTADQGVAFSMGNWPNFPVQIYHNTSFGSRKIVVQRAGSGDDRRINIGTFSNHIAQIWFSLNGRAYEFRWRNETNGDDILVSGSFSADVNTNGAGVVLGRRPDGAAGSANFNYLQVGVWGKSGLGWDFDDPFAMLRPAGF